MFQAMHTSPLSRTVDFEENYCCHFFVSQGICWLPCLSMTGQQVHLADPAPAPAAGSDKQPSVPALEHMDQAESDGFHVKVLPSTGECSFMISEISETGKDKEDPKEIPSEFRKRQAYIELEKEGCVDIPPMTGLGLFYHSSSQQWHTRFGKDLERNCAPKWSPTLRSERKSILIALVAMWKWYADTTKAGADKKYHAILAKKLAETEF